MGLTTGPYLSGRDCKSSYGVSASLLKRWPFCLRVVENLTGNYVFFMGMYRALYGVNWVYRAHYQPGYRHHYFVYICGAVQTLLFMEFFYYCNISKMRGRELHYGEEGDIEYYDCNVQEMRNHSNSSPLIENSNVRARGKSNVTCNDDELGDILVV